MDVREKLIEILRKPIFPHELVDPIEAVADYLLDNGVTVQEWISVDISIHPPRAGRDCNHAQNLFHAFLRNTQSNVQSSYRLHIGECFYGSYVFCFSVTRLFFGANPSVLP